jgi:hypothetical protein
MHSEDLAWASARMLCEAGVLVSVRRSGFEPVAWKEEVDIELAFEGGRTFNVTTARANHANDIWIREGVALELDYDHLRVEDPEHFAETVAAWKLMPEPDADWAIGATLHRPVRVEMTKPYTLTVGFAFDCERDGKAVGRLVMFAEADVLFIVREDHPEALKHELRTVLR